jgi:hypothetical protein
MGTRDAKWRCERCRRGPQTGQTWSDGGWKGTPPAPRRQSRACEEDTVRKSSRRRETAHKSLWREKKVALCGPRSRLSDAVTGARTHRKGDVWRGEREGLRERCRFSSSSSSCSVSLRRSNMSAGAVIMRLAVGYERWLWPCAATVARRTGRGATRMGPVWAFIVGGSGNRS